MRILYEPTSDTIDIDFRSEITSVYETVDGPNEDVLLDLDEDGRLVGLTILNASRRTDLSNLKEQPQFEEVGPSVEA